MHSDNRSVLLVSMPFACVNIPSIQLSVLEAYLKERDTDVEVRNLYLKAADFYGVKNYISLTNPPNEPYVAQAIFSKYVFPDSWEENEDKFKHYFEKKMYKEEDFSFSNYLESTDNFYNWTIDKINWKEYDIIGFTLNYGQFLPSLAVAKSIKEKYPEKKIVFGGSRVVGYLGIKILEVFDYIDFIVSGEGEEPLYLLTNENPNYNLIPNLIYKKEGKVIWNRLDYCADLDNQQIPLYNQFFRELSDCSSELQQIFYQTGILPIEICRGCWWGRCTFCNQKVIHPYYREKSVDRFVEELEFLSNRYRILDFIIIGETMPKNIKPYLERIIDLGKDFTFIAELRADHLKREDYLLLKKAGFNIVQTGVESFSKNYLRKINKGVGVIDNIAALKFCKENRITNKYNIIVDYPNEEGIDFEETKKVVQIIRHYLDPPNICKLRVVYGSPIYCNKEHFNISDLEPFDIDKIMFPKEIIEKGICFVYSYKTKEEKKSFEWDELVNRWKIEKEMIDREASLSNNLIDKYLFYFVDGKNFIKIYDKRNLKDIKIYILNEVERDVFLSCLDIISIDELKEKFPHIEENFLLSILKNFEENSIVFREGNRYLALPLSYRSLENMEYKIDVKKDVILKLI